MPDRDLRDALAKLRRKRDDAESEAAGAREKLQHELAVNTVHDLDVNRVSALAEDVKIRMTRYQAINDEYERWRDLL